MALQTECIHVRRVQQTRIGRAVRRMANGAAFGLHDWMLINEGPGSFCMAFHANCVLVGCGLELRGLKCAMRIVAVAALHQSFIYFVMERLCECRFQVCMAGVAKLRLRYLQQTRLVLKLMNTMTTDAAQVGLAMFGAFKVGMRGCVAAKASLIDLLY